MVCGLVVTCFWMDTEGALQQVVHPFTDIDIESWVTILQHDFFLKVLALLGSALQKRRKSLFGNTYLKEKKRINSRLNNAVT